jgi:hypothetical protein
MWSFLGWCSAPSRGNLFPHPASESVSWLTPVDSHPSTLTNMTPGMGQCSLACKLRHCHKVSYTHIVIGDEI